jgi:predicted SnoaL-like aldol condensation-catalyzing enzyme
LEALKEFVAGVWKAFPDLEVTIDTMFADKVADGEPWVGALVTLRGSHAEQDLTIDLREFWTFRIREGKIAERWFVVDRAALTG